MTKQDQQRADRILAFIREAVAERGYPPSVREIAEAVGLASTSAVHHHLTKLEKEVNKVLDSYTAEREERVQELNESLDRRIAHLKNGKTTKFNDDDHLWVARPDGSGLSELPIKGWLVDWRR